MPKRLHNETLKLDIARNLTLIRKNLLQMSTLSLANKSGIKYDTLRSYERATSNIPSHILYRIAHAVPSAAIPYELFFEPDSATFDVRIRQLRAKFGAVLRQASNSDDLLNIINNDVENLLRVVGLYLSMSRKVRPNVKIPKTPDVR